MIKGKAWKFGDDVNTDEVIPARYLNTSDPRELAAHCMEDADASFAAKHSPGDVIVAGRNFGCGSSREHAPLAIKTAGVSCVIAESFARIFFRNAINIGLPIIESPEAARAIRAGDAVEADLAAGVVRSAGKSFSVEKYPEALQSIIEAGGLMNRVRRSLSKG
jgi:3-isopropylmalate dehydratase small subunit